MSFEGLLDPTGRAAGLSQHTVPTRATLSHCRLGLLDNTKPNAAELLDLVADLLASQYSLKDITRRKKPSMGVPGPDTLLDELSATCDVVIVGVGD